MSRPHIVVVGAGFAGHEAARRLLRSARGRAVVTLVNPTDYFLYAPLLPEVATGVLEPRRATVSLTQTLPGARLVLGKVDGIDLDRRAVTYSNPEGMPGSLGYDRLVLTVGSVNKLLPIPGVARYAHGFRGLAEALYLRDTLVRQIELADGSDEAEARARSTFVVVGAGYTGTEVAAAGVLFTDALTRQHPGLGDVRPRWMLLDLADRVLPGLDPRMSREAERVLRGRGVDVRTGVSVEEAGADGVRLTDGSFVPTRSLIWCVGVRPDPLVADLGLETAGGRLVVDEYLAVPGHPEVLACGDAAAVPDLTRPGELTAMTAQHAVRQGRLAAANVAASFGDGERRRYKHHDLGFVVDLAGPDAVANPVGVPLSRLPAKAVTRGYHLLSIPGNRIRVGSDWLLDALLPRQAVQTGLVTADEVPLGSTTATGPGDDRHPARRETSTA
jgi:NADH:ubiquinone reductase (H+-translocating)